MASESGRGAQVRLDGDARQLARGGAGLRLIDSIRQKAEMEALGTAPNGNAADGSLPDGTAADDVVLAPGGTMASIAAVPLKANLAVNVANYTVNTGDGTTDNTAAFMAALATGRPVYVPHPATAWVVDNLTVPSGAVIFGEGARVQAKAGSFNPAFLLTAASDVEIRGLDLVGNAALTRSLSSGSCAISGTGCTRVRIVGNRIRDWTRHAVVFQSATDIMVEGNFISGSWYGAGVVCSNNLETSYRVTVQNNVIRNTQWASITAIGHIEGWIVQGNICDGSGQGGDDGEVQDNITAYKSGVVNALIANNVCTRSVNHGIHVGGRGIIISGNRIDLPTSFGILVAEQDNTSPYPVESVQITGNTVMGSAVGACIGVRNATGFTVSDNVLDGGTAGVELYGLTTNAPDGAQGGTICGNVIRNTPRGIRWRGLVKGVIVSANVFDTVTAEHQLSEFSGASISDQVLGVNSYKATTRIYNGLSFEPSLAASSVSLFKARGDASNLILDLSAKGTSRIRLVNDNGVQAQFGISSATGVAYPYGFGGSTAATYSAEGSASNLNVVLQPKGTGGHILASVASSLSLTANGQLGFQATSDTTLTLKYRGSDGVTRSVALTLA
jgi:nitrous oxidase accessory protein NosD